MNNELYIIKSGKLFIVPVQNMVDSQGNKWTVLEWECMRIPMWWPVTFMYLVAYTIYYFICGDKGRHD